MTAADHHRAEALPRGAPQDLSYRDEERWPFYADDEIDSVVSVLRSGKVNQWTGDHVFAFERAVAERFGLGPTIALANGSVALELALRALGIGPGDDVVVTPRSFAASAFCVKLVGAEPVFADVDPASGNLSAASIAEVLTDRTRAIIPVHLAGWPADMPAIMALAAERGLKVIEDCAQAHGAEIDGASVGSFGDAACFSFCQDKIISTAGEGGSVSFKDPRHFEWAWSFKDHGKNRDKMRAPQVQPGLFRYVHDQVGTNWRLTGPQAAVGLAQLAKLGEWRELRSRNAAIWAEALAGVPGIEVPQPAADVRHALYKLYAYVAPGTVRFEILRRAAAEGLRVFSGSCPEIYREQAFADMRVAGCPVAADLGERSLMVEVHPTLDPVLLKQRAERLAAIARDVLAGA